jgi:hypothetical protein
MQLRVTKDLSFYQVSLGISTVVSATIISFKEYFLVNPFAGSVGLISLLQAVSMVSLLSLVVVPPFMMSGPSNLTNRKLNFFMVSVVAWPVSLMLLRFAVMQATGLFVVDYWLSYPILFLCEFGATAIYIYMATVEKRLIRIARS